MERVASTLNQDLYYCWNFWETKKIVENSLFFSMHFWKIFIVNVGFYVCGGRRTRGF